MNTRTRRPGHVDLSPGVWLLAGGCGAWLIVLAAAHVIQMVAMAAAGALL